MKSKISCWRLVRSMISWSLGSAGLEGGTNMCSYSSAARGRMQASVATTARSRPERPASVDLASP